MIIDAWAQHPTARHLQDPIFDSLRRWTKGALAPQTELPLSATIAAMDQAGVGKSLISAWYAPRNVMISNDQHARRLKLHYTNVSWPYAAPRPGLGNAPG